MKLVFIELVVFCLTSGLYGETRLFSIEKEASSFYLRAYDFTGGYANLDVARRRLNRVVPELNEYSKIEKADFGIPWGPSQLIVMTPMGGLVDCRVYELAEHKAAESLLLRAQFQILPDLGALNYLDLLSYDSMNLGSEQLRLIIKTNRGSFEATFVAPISPEGKWCQTNWKQIAQVLPKGAFQLLNGRGDDVQIYDRQERELRSSFDAETEKQSFILAQVGDLLVSSDEENRYCFLNTKTRQLSSGVLSDQTLLSRNRLEFEGEVLDLVLVEDLVSARVSEINQPIQWTKSFRLNRHDELWKNWPEENERFKIKLQAQYFGDEVLDRAELTWKLWWKVPSPSWDLSQALIAPDQTGMVRRPLEQGFMLDFEHEFHWPYEWQDGKHTDISSTAITPYWTIAIIEQEQKGWHARLEMPWLSKPLTWNESKSTFETYEVLNFFTSLKQQWRQKGGLERSALFFSGFIENSELKGLSAKPMELSSFWTNLQPWGYPTDHFDELWIATWNKQVETFPFPNYQNNLKLFDSWKIAVELADGVPLQKGLWKLESELGEKLFEAEVNQGLVNVLTSELSDIDQQGLMQCWQARSVREIVIDSQRNRSYQFKHKHQYSGAEKLGWLWIDFDRNVNQKITLPWGSALQVWTPKQYLWHHQGQWHLKLMDDSAKLLNIRVESAREVIDKEYSFQKGQVEIPLELQGCSIQAISLQTKKRASLQWAQELALFKFDRAIAMHQEMNNQATWLVEVENEKKLLQWQGLRVVESFELNEFKTYEIQKAGALTDHLWLFMLDRPYMGHRLLQWAPQYEDQTVLGGDGGILEQPSSFAVLGDILLPNIVVGDVKLESILLFSSEFQQLDAWKKSGFQPSAMAVDPINANEFWTLDRKQSGQSFLYHFSIESKQLKLLQVFLDPIVLSADENFQSTGMAVCAKTQDSLNVAFCDRKGKRVLEYHWQRGQVKLELEREYIEGLKDQGQWRLNEPRTLLYVKDEADVMLYVMDGKDTFVRLK